jgi:hypothetical protein
MIFFSNGRIQLISQLDIIPVEGDFYVPGICPSSRSASHKGGFPSQMATTTHRRSRLEFVGEMG